MPDWPDKDEALINEFLDQLGYASHHLWGYRSMLRHFQRFMSKRKRLLNVPGVQSWVKTSAGTTSPPFAIQRVVFVKRFLDWLVKRGIVPHNPFTQLREQYECSSTAAIARALLQPDSNSALEALRPPPRYASHLGPLMREHVQRMRVLGMRYSHEDKFVRFDLYLQERVGAETESFAALARDYVAEVSSSATKVDRLRVTRVVAKALQREGVAVAEPARDRLLIQEVARRRVKPYIYSVAEIGKLLETARGYGSSTAPLRSAALYCMVTLAYCAGLRLGELAGLQMKDVDLDEQTIEIRDTKFFKSRVESAEVAAILSQPNRITAVGQRDHALLSFLYNSGARIQEALDLRPKDLHLKSPAHVRLMGKGRKERIAPLWPETAELLTALLRRTPRLPEETLFINRYGEPLTASGFRFRLKQYVKAAIKKVPSLSEKRVTPHLFRHTTAVHLVSAGVDVTVIRSWLGHASLDTTNHYAQANLETKRRALEQADPKLRPAKPPRWKRDVDLLAWLDSL